jgi:hypothetical protein
MIYAVIPVENDRQPQLVPDRGPSLQTRFVHVPVTPTSCHVTTPDNRGQESEGLKMAGEDRLGLRQLRLYELG